MSVEEKHSMKFCGTCGKIIRSGRKGTMTSWIFGGNACSCDSGQQTSLYQQGDLLEGDDLQFPTASSTSLRGGATFPDLGSRFEILAFLGEGGMGSVYKIREVETCKIFAAKVLKDYMASDPSAIKRFELEVRAASELTHPNLVFVYGSYRTADGAPYMVMNFIDGTSLGDTLKFQRTLPTKRALPIFTQVADALDHAHSKRIVHRDLKPNNILIYQHESQRDAVRVVDFGIAKMINQDIKHTSGITQTGELFGSPLYMSPEQCSGDELDARSDIYSLGCVIYHTLCGRPPFHDSNAMKTMIAHMQTPPPSLGLVNKSLEIPKDLEKVVMRCLAKNPDQRYQSAMALSNDLKAIQAGNSISRGDLRANVSASQWKTLAIVASSFSVGIVVAVGATLFVVHNSAQTGRTDKDVQPRKTDAGLDVQFMPTDREHRAKSVADAAPVDPVLAVGDKFANHQGPGEFDPMASTAQGSGTRSAAGDSIANIASVDPSRSRQDSTNQDFMPEITSRTIILSAKKKHLTELRLPWAGDADLELLRNSPYLESLSLEGASVTDKGLECIAGSPIKKLALRGCNCKTLHPLQPLARLKILELDSMTITPVMAAEVAKAKSLEELVLRHVKIKDANFEQFTALPNLRILKIVNVGLGNKAWSALNQMESLKALTIEDDSLTDDNIGNFHAVPLESLEITRGQFSGLGAMYLGTNKTLKVLRFVDCPSINDTVLAYLRSKMKFCRIERYSSSMNSKLDGRLPTASVTGTAHSGNGASSAASDIPDRRAVAKIDPDSQLIEDSASAIIASNLKHRSKTIDLNFAQTSVNDADLKLLENATDVTSLYLDATSITTRGLEHLIHTKIDSLHLINGHFTDLTPLAKMPLLQSVTIIDSKLGPTGIRDILASSTVDEIRVTHVNLTTQDLAAIGNSNLRVASLAGCDNITDEGLQNLTKCSKLRILIIRNCAKISPSTMNLLRMQLPGCTMEYQQPKKTGH